MVVDYAFSATGYEAVAESSTSKYPSFHGRSRRQRATRRRRNSHGQRVDSRFVSWLLGCHCSVWSQKNAKSRMRWRGCGESQQRAQCNGDSHVDGDRQQLSRRGGAYCLRSEAAHLARSKSWSKSAITSAARKQA